MMRPLFRTVLFISLVFRMGVFGTEGEWRELFDGETLKGWRAVSNANWRVEDGAIVVDEGEEGLLVHEDVYGDYELTVEFRAAAGTNSGVFLNTTDKPKDVKSDCYELNIAPPGNAFPTGSIVGRTRVEGVRETEAWHRFEVRVKQGHVTVKLDGKLIVDAVYDPPAGGKGIGLQKNGGAVAFRKIRVRKLD